MKYDFTRCNNLQFKAKVQGIERKGYLKVLNEENVCMFYSDENKAFNVSLQFEYALCSKSFTNMMDFNLWAENHDLEIIPRDPETYTDWKKGDYISHKGAGCDYHIAAKLGDIVFLIAETRIDTKPVTATTGLLTKYYKLILTDYEQELLGEKEKEKCPFKEGDKVLVRDFNSCEWRFAIFASYNKDSKEPYKMKSSLLSYRQCISLNEHTWRLLGTADECETIDNNESR